ncbi:MAG: PBP1A family penicillin-binding protein [candidate division WOR-3 bacterium]
MVKPKMPSAEKKRTHRLKWIFIILGPLCAGFLLGLYIQVVHDLPPSEAISFYTPPVATKVYDDQDSLFAEFFIERRELASLKDMPEYLKKGFICIEDKSFYKHWGVDMKGIFRALFQNLLRLRAAQGFSTITMQLARNMFLTQEKTLLRKLKEIALAIRIERTYTKDEILERYLNQVNFGQGRYGVATAARYYFNKSVSDLTLSECALLVALPKSPEYLSPYRFPERAKARRNLVLKMMLKDRIITQEEYEKAINEPLNVKPPQKGHQIGEYFLEEIRRYLELKYGVDFLYRSGASIYTTINRQIQEISEEVLEKHLCAIEKDYKLMITKSRFDSLGIPDTLDKIPYLQGALMVVDHRHGEIKALIGGRDFNQSKFNRATQAKRQTGSAFKVFVFLTALDNGFTPADQVLDLPIVMEVAGPDSIYRPANYDHKFLGPITMRKALALSRNLVAVRLIRIVGPDLVVKYAYDLGIKSKLLPVVSLALGSCEVSLAELTQAFSTIANLGEERSFIMIRKIVSREGTIIEMNKPTIVRKLSPQVCYLMINLMRSVVDGGTGYEIRKYYKGPAAGKTGTTDNYSDAWFVGFTPHYTAGVWVGFDDNRTIFKGATGGVVSAPIWGDIIARIDTLITDDFPVPEGIIWVKICPKSGLLANEYCPAPREEPFIAGTEPKEKCDIHTLETKLRGEEEFEKLDRSALDGY